MAIFLKEDNGSTKASIRAKNTAHHIDARNFSVMFGGGGHKGSGGFKIPKTPRENFDMIVEKAVEFLKEASENK